MEEPTFINLTAANIDEHHLCCALGDKKHVGGVEHRRAWLKRRLQEGLVFRKLDVRGEVFIEYMPAEKAWRPFVAPGWLAVHCLWVSGQYAKRGHGRALVEYALEDARRQRKHGVVIAAAKTKRPFLADPKFLKHLGFEAVDTAGEFVLFARRVPGPKEGPAPRFSPSVQGVGAPTEGAFVATATNQCPFNTHWGPEVVRALQAQGEEASLVTITRRAQAQKVASPLGTYGLERDGTLVCHHLTSDGATARMFAKVG